MSGLIKAMDEAMYQAERIPDGMARAAALAAAVWFQGHGHAVGAWAADMIRAEMDRDVSSPPADDLAGPAHGVVTVERTSPPAAEDVRRVRIEWPSGRAVEGPVDVKNGHERVWVPGYAEYRLDSPALVGLVTDIPSPVPTPAEVTLPPGSVLLAGEKGEQGRWVTNAPITLIWDGTP